MDILSSNSPEGNPSEKRCNACGQIFPATTEFFSPRVGRKPGSLQSRCKQCQALTVRARRQNPGDYTHSQEAKDKKRLYDQKRRDVYREKHREVQKRYRLSHKDKLREDWRKDYASHLEARRLLKRVNQNKRRVLAKNAHGSYTKQDVQDQYERQSRKCYWCHKHLNRHFHLDHVIPLSRGGRNSIDNIVIACPTCNMRKHGRLPHEWPEGGRLL